MPHPGRNNDREGRNGPHRTFPRNNRHNRRIVNCAVGGDLGGGNGNVDYFNGDRGNSEYQWNHTQSQVNFEETVTMVPQVG